MNERERRALIAALYRLRDAQRRLLSSMDIAPADPPPHHWAWERARTQSRLFLLRIMREARTA